MRGALLCAVFSVTLAAGCLGPTTLEPVQPVPIVIRNVTVISGRGDAAMPAMTIVLRGDRIAAIGPAAETVVPSGSQVVDGTGKYVIPGLIDLHVHLSKTRASALGLFLVSGVTTVRDMGGDVEELARWRREVNGGRRHGPRIYMAGPILESVPNVERMRRDSPPERAEPFDRVRVAVGSPAEARRVVARLAAGESDFIKIRTVQDSATYRALNAAADDHGIPLVGHVTGIAPTRVLASGQDGIDHMFYPSLPANMSREERLAVWRAFAAREVPIVPTVVTFFASSFPTGERLRAVLDDSAGTLDPRRPYISRYLLRDWAEQVTEWRAERSALLRRVWETVVRRDLREMHEAGMDVLAGSDAAVVNIFPGSSLHEELALLVSEVGMTPGEAIARASGRAARLLGAADDIGTIERGRIADLVLLDADPLVDIRNTQRISAVVVRGVVHDAAALDAIRRAVLAAPDVQADDWGRQP